MKVIFTSLALLCCTLLSAQKKLIFEKMAIMPNEAYAFGYTQSADEIYAFGGGEDFKRFSSYLHIYDTRSEIWITNEIKEIPLTKYASSVYLEAYKGILVLGGTRPYGTSVGLVDEIRMINPDDFKVTTLGTLPEPAKDMGIANDGKKVYFFGGSTRMERNMFGTANFQFSKKFFVYDLEVGHMEMLPDLPKAMETNGGIVDGNLYVFGGFNRNPLTSIWQYNLKEKTWTELEPFDRPVSSYALAQYGRYFILAGDFYDGNQLIVYDTRNRKAEYFKTNFAGRHMGASVMGEYLHVYGGFSNNKDNFIKHDHYRISIKNLIESLDQ